MYDDEIRRELKDCESFVGVFMADTIPRSNNHKSNGLMREKKKSIGEQGMIINLDSSNELGSHWVAFWNNADGTGEYFDSFGSPPPSYIKMSLECLSPSRIIYSNAALQHKSSSSCGLYCIFFIKHKCLGASLPRILSHFSRSQGVNEIIVTLLNPECT